MTSTEQSILDALVELERTIELMPRTTPKPDLLPLFSRIENLTRALPPPTDPTLLHYLHKKSYQKARLFLQGRDAENTAGNCHGHLDANGQQWKPEPPVTSPAAGGDTPPAH